MILNEIEQIITLVFAAIVTGFFVKWLMDYNYYKNVAKTEETKKAVEDDKIKIRSEYNDESLDKLVDSSTTIYRKLGPPKDN